MSLKVLAAVIVATLLTGCQTMTPEERRAADEAKCSSYGFKRKTDAFAACLQRIDLDRSADMRARDAEFARFTARPPVVIYRPVVVKQ